MRVIVGVVMVVVVCAGCASSAQPGGGVRPPASQIQLSGSSANDICKYLAATNALKETRRAFDHQIPNSDALARIRAEITTASNQAPARMQTTLRNIDLSLQGLQKVQAQGGGSLVDAIGSQVRRVATECRARGLPIPNT